MKRISVNSSNLVSVGYEHNVLEIEFHNGSVYQYCSVPESEYDGLMNASSHGKYLDQNIKGKYRYTQIR